MESRSNEPWIQRVRILSELLRPTALGPTRPSLVEVGAFQLRRELYRKPGRKALKHAVKATL